MQVDLSKIKSIQTGLDWSTVRSEYGEPADTHVGDNGTITYTYIYPDQGHLAVITDLQAKVLSSWVHRYSGTDTWSPKPGALVEYARADKQGAMQFGVFAGQFTVGSTTFIGIKPMISFTDETSYETSDVIMYMNPMYMTALEPINSQRALVSDMTIANKKLDAARKQAEEAAKAAEEAAKAAETDKPDEAKPAETT